MIFAVHIFPITGPAPKLQPESTWRFGEFVRDSWGNILDKYCIIEEIVLEGAD